MQHCTNCGKGSDSLDSKLRCAECRPPEESLDTDSRDVKRRGNKQRFIKRFLAILAISALVVFVVISLINYANDPVHDRQLKSRAKAGDVDAMFELGMLYKNHANSSTKSREKAKYWLYQSGIGLTGNALGHYELGMMDIDSGDKINASFGFEYLKSAAEMGLLEAQVYVGLCYASGRGTRQNDVDALKWFIIAEEKKKGAGRYYIDELQPRMLNEDIAYAVSSAEHEIKRMDESTVIRQKKLQAIKLRQTAKD